MEPFAAIVRERFAEVYEREAAEVDLADLEARVGGLASVG